ncbi:MAG: hypothetical protein NTW32_01615 [Chloroflexi bacterium]|nr:hypothetical protein [Chloroflexota bacterium]
MTDFDPRTSKHIKLMILTLTFLFAFSACGRFESIPYDPPQTPGSWLTIQPYTEFKLGSQNIILVQPSTTFFVYLLGLLTIGLGVYFLRIRAGQRSRLWWGIAMLLWGLGALLAGTSYEAFSYAIKCAGREACIWTSWWEIIYLLVTIWSFDAIFLAVAYSSSTGIWRKLLIGYAVLNAVAYLGLLLAGAFIPVKFWISFEMLILVSSPGILVFFFINLGRYLKNKAALDLALVGTWLGLGLTTAAYFIFYTSGISETLWARGTWFTANDVLHILLILWMLYIGLVVARRVKDLPNPV